MAPTEGRVAQPERQWGCHCGTLITYYQSPYSVDTPQITATLPSMGAIP